MLVAKYVSWDEVRNYPVTKWVGFKRGGSDIGTVPAGSRVNDLNQRVFKAEEECLLIAVHIYFGQPKGIYEMIFELNMEPFAVGADDLFIGTKTDLPRAQNKRIFVFDFHKHGSETYQPSSINYRLPLPLKLEKEEEIYAHVAYNNMDTTDLSFGYNLTLIILERE